MGSPFHFPSAKNPTLGSGLTRPRSDPYIPSYIFAALVENKGQSRASKSFDDLASSVTQGIAPEYSTVALPVKTCKNCTHAFHVRSLSSSSNLGSVSPLRSASNDFCSKDCETCFTLFPKSAPSQSNQTVRNDVLKKTKSEEEEIRQSIYAFQQELLQAEAERKVVQFAPTIEEVNINNNLVDEASTEVKIEPICDTTFPTENEKDKNVIDKEELIRIQLQAAKKSFNVRYFQELKQQKLSCLQKGNKHPENLSDQIYVYKNNNDLFSWIFPQPKPVRPQLHSFI